MNEVLSFFGALLIFVGFGAIIIAMVTLIAFALGYGYKMGENKANKDFYMKLGQDIGKKMVSDIEKMMKGSLTQGDKPKKK